MSEPNLPGTPGTGPPPEPEPEGFRDEKIAEEEERQAKEREEAEQRSKDAKEQYSGKPQGGPLVGAPGDESYEQSRGE